MTPPPELDRRPPRPLPAWAPRLTAPRIIFIGFTGIAVVLVLLGRLAWNQYGAITGEGEPATIVKTYVSTTSKGNKHGHAVVRLADGSLHVADVHEDVVPMLRDGDLTTAYRFPNLLTGERVIIFEGRKKGKREAIVFAVSSILFTPLFFLSGLALFSRARATRRTLAEGSPVLGTVEDVKSRPGKGGHWHVIRYRYQPSRGGELEGTHRTWDAPLRAMGVARTPRPGDGVWLAVDPSDPKRAVVWTYTEEKA